VNRTAVLFDLGGTLAYYYEMLDFPGLLEQAITEVQEYLLKEGKLLQPPLGAEELIRRVRQEDHETKDYRVRPSEHRFCRIFELDASKCSDKFVLEMCRCFLRPIFARGHCYDDSVPTPKGLRSKGIKIGIISNTSWGSPAALWREEIDRLGLGDLFDATIFCRDVGSRKPANQIFQFALQKLNADPQD